jgi:hypothetical protein
MITIEPFRAGISSGKKKLLIEAHLIDAGGFISVNTQVIPLMNTPINKRMLTLLLMQRLVLVVVLVWLLVRTLQRCCLWQSIPVRFVTSR